MLEGRYFKLATDEYLREEVPTQLGILRIRKEQYTRAHAAVDPAGRTGIIVDDGVAFVPRENPRIGGRRPRTSSQQSERVGCDRVGRDRTAFFKERPLHVGG
jgi:hypothetical protein